MTSDGQPETLAELLGVPDPKTPDRSVPEIPAEVFRTMSAKDFARLVLVSPQYRESLLRRILFDELPPALECLLYHYAWGKPTERVEVTDHTPRLEDMTSEQLEARALLLAHMARTLREQEHGPQRTPTTVN